ncbi:MAG: site-2 protease family protein [Actinomycetota bacterium]
MIPRRGLHVATFRGIGIYLHWSWFAVFVLLFWVVTQFFRDNQASGPSSYLPAAFLTTILFFLSVLLHELAHSMVATRNGVPINRITLFVFGGVAQMGKEVTSPGVEFKMAVAGPLCSYVLCLLFGGLAYAAYALGLKTVSFGFTLLAAVNFGLGTFNLVPGFPLDGGRVLRSLLWHHWGDLERSTRAAARLGQGVGALLALGGAGMLLLDLLHEGYDLLFSGAWFILIGTFLIQAAAGSLHQARLRAALEGRRVEDVLRPGTPAVDLSTTLAEVYGVYLKRAPRATVPVLGQGKLVAEVRLSDLRRVRSDRWEDTPVSEVAAPIRPGEACAPDRTLLEALALLERSGREFLWVVEGGRLLGVVLRSDLHRLAAG